MFRFLLPALILVLSSGISAAQDAENCVNYRLDLDVILDACTRALANAPSDEDAARFLAHRGYQHTGPTGIERSLADYHAAIERDPRQFLAFYRLYHLAVFDYDPVTAQHRIDRAIAADPDAPTAYLSQLTDLLSDTDPTACLPLTRTLTDLLPPLDSFTSADTLTGWLLGAQADCYRRNDLFEEALELLLAVTVVDPDYYLLNRRITTTAHARMSRPDLVIQYGTLALENGTYGSDITMAVILAHVSLEQLDEALTAMQTYGHHMYYDHEDRRARSALAWALLVDGRAADASQVIEPWAVLSLRDREAGNWVDGGVWDTVAHVRARLGDSQGAADAYETAFRNMSDVDFMRERYRTGMTQIGISVGEGNQGILDAIRVCAEMGPVCMMVSGIP